MATIIRKTSPEVSVLSEQMNSICRYIGPGAKYHLDASEVVVTAPASSSLATSLVLVNQIKRVYNGSVSTVYGGWIGHRSCPLAHVAADSTNTVTSADATTLATAITLANEMKTKINAHFTKAGVHANNDIVNTVTAANATIQADLDTLLNDIKAKLNLHLASAPTEVSMLRVLDA